MATLPTSPVEIGAAIAVGQDPSLTWYCDQRSGRINGTCDGYAAVKQAVEIILNTDRFRWQIYLPSSGTDYSGLIGLDEGYVAVELQRRISEALMMDSRVTGVSNYTFEIQDSSLIAYFTVDTLYGPIREQVEVII